KSVVARKLVSSSSYIGISKVVHHSVQNSMTIFHILHNALVRNPDVGASRRVYVKGIRIHVDVSRNVSIAAMLNNQVFVTNGMTLRMRIALWSQPKFKQVGKDPVARI
ncbi:2084_t:CDS:1, partial [Acaulospora morrowiae]